MLKVIIYKIIEFIERIQYRKHVFDEANPLHKIIDVVNVKNLKVKTDYGFVPFSEINITSPMSLYRLTLENGQSLDCADSHIIFTKDHQTKFINDLTIDDYVLCEDDFIHGIKVKSITKIPSKVSLIDLTIDEPEMSYYTNGLLSHNTVSAAITILQFCLFNTNKNVMIVANKGGTVNEIIDKIKGIYKLLPFYLKVGIINWNQSSITFDNGCRIKTDKRSKEPAIGFSIDLLYLDEFAHIPNNFIEPYYTAVVPVVSAIKNSRIIITSTPKGLNLFHKLFSEASLTHDDPNWNGFHSLEVYWWQISGRRDTKILLSKNLMLKHNIDENELIDYLSNLNYTCVKVKDEGFDCILVQHDKLREETNISHIRTIRYNDIPLSEFSIITNWQEQQTKLIGGEDAFKQEFDLQFITGDKMLFDSITLEKIIENSRDFKYFDIPVFNQKLPILYSGLKFIDDPYLFNLTDAKNYHIGISVDLGEGLGRDYSIINIFRLLPKSDEEIKHNEHKYNDKYDYFKLEQIGIFKSNIYSVKEVADILYMITFELFNDEYVKIALEKNTYGSELLAHMPHIFNDRNKYSDHVFVRYKQRIEDKFSKKGIVINSNKKLLIKDYQINTKKGNIIIHDRYTISEINTFTRHDTPSGDLTFKAEIGHDDAIMSVITMSTFFASVSYRDMVDNYITKNNYKENVSKMVVRDEADFTSVLKAKQQLMNRNNQRPNMYSGNNNTRYSGGY